MRKFFLLTTFICISCGLSACGTIEGAGRDIENAGQAIQKTF